MNDDRARCAVCGHTAEAHDPSERRYCWERKPDGSGQLCGCPGYQEAPIP